MNEVDIPDEVHDAALYEASVTGTYPKWFLDLKAGTHRGPVPAMPKDPEARKRWKAAWHHRRHR